MFLQSCCTLRFLIPVCSSAFVLYPRRFLFFLDPDPSRCSSCSDASSAFFFFSSSASSSTCIPFALCVREPREDPGCAAFSGRIVSPKTDLRTIVTKGWSFHTQNQIEPLYHSIVIRFTKSIGG
ncbi:hypothetical protein BDW42DRAFT_30596 [Aspergillus taichungensis]|uniref:Uncharacterized protein n=1 Tax=Aspergillus taichungensis TaxID=482145 RepID=A0A2J5I4B4_9EURO|nr:hypothetical protein BDW42DRAFT_30596 [Aspergillus taichungensis]